MEKLAEINAFRVGNTTVSSTFLMRLRFQGYRCKSDIFIFALGGSLEITRTVSLFFPSESLLNHNLTRPRPERCAIIVDINPSH